MNRRNLEVALDRARDAVAAVDGIASAVAAGVTVAPYGLSYLVERLFTHFDEIETAMRKRPSGGRHAR